MAPELEMFVMRCLEKEREMRYESVRELAAALARCGYAGQRPIEISEFG